MSVSLDLTYSVHETTFLGETVSLSKKLQAPFPQEGCQEGNNMTDIYITILDLRLQS